MKLNSFKKITICIKANLSPMSRQYNKALNTPTLTSYWQSNLHNVAHISEGTSIDGSSGSGRSDFVADSVSDS